MYIGVIAEGKSDLAVIKNIIRGKFKNINYDIQYLQPELDYDETDLYDMTEAQFSNWELVKKACIEKKKFSDFFSVDEERYIILQIDTAEAELGNYNVRRPKKHNNSDYSEELRNNIIQRINEWSDNQFYDQLFYAVAVEETEAWVLTIYSDDKKDTCRFSDPKRELDRILNIRLGEKEKKILNYDEFKKFDELSRDFRKLKNLNRFMLLNQSLNLFCASLERLI